MNNKIIISTLCIAAIGLAGCSKKQAPFKSDYFSTNPNPLETVGNGVPGVVTGNVPEKFIRKNARITATPVLEYADGRTAGQPVTIQGENVRANGQIVSWTNGGSFTIPFNVAYTPEMEKSNLWLTFQVDQNGKTYALPQVKVGTGVLATSTLASVAGVQPAIAKDKFQKVITEKYTADIHFLINQANVRGTETGKADYIDLNRRLLEANSAPNQEIAGITVSSYASPEGSYQFNENLAQRREQNTTALMENQLKKDKIQEFGELTSSFTPEDWDGFRELVEKSNIQDKDLILAVLSMQTDPEQREKEIRNLSSVFNELADQILPQLRYSRVQASINVIGKSDEQLISLFNTDPKALTVDEILYVATLTDDNTRKMDIYNKATELFPNDFRTWNNLGVTKYIAGDYAAARSNFNKAATLTPNSKEIEMNEGLLSMLDGNWQRANEYLGSAAGLPETADALGTYYLAQGDLTKAVNAFGNNKSNNAALAQILVKDYTAANETLAGIANPNALTYYITAVLGARTNNENMVMSNLRQAVRLDSSLLKRAQNDLEFANFNLGYL